MMHVATRSLAAVLVLLTACSGEPLTRDEFTRQAEERCAAANARIEEALQTARSADPEPGGTEREREFLSTVTAELESQLEDLRDLRPPEEVAGDVDAMLDEADSALSAVREAGTEALQQETNPFARANELAADLGLEECAR